MKRKRNADDEKENSLNSDQGGTANKNRKIESMVPEYWQMIKANSVDKIEPLTNIPIINQRLFKKLHLFQNIGRNNKSGSLKKAVENLLNKGKVDIDVQDEYGNTILHYIVLHKLQAITKLLLYLGARIDIPNKIGETAYVLCQRTIEEDLSNKNCSLLNILDMFNKIMTEKKHDTKYKFDIKFITNEEDNSSVFQVEQFSKNNYVPNSTDNEFTQKLLGIATNFTIEKI